MLVIIVENIGFPHDPADILIRDGNKVLREVQAKSSDKASSALFEMSDKKYEGMQKLFNSDKVDKARELAEKRVEAGTLKAPEYADTLENMTGELKHGEICSGGTSYNEAMEAARNPQGYSHKLESKQFREELCQSVKSTMIASIVIGGGISVLKNSISLCKSEIDSKEFVGNVVIDTGKAGLRGGVTGMVSTGVRTVAQKSGNAILSKTNVATSIAVGMIDVGITVIDFIKGDIDSEQAMIQIGEKGFSTMASVYSGMTAGVVFGPGGALVGSLIGYMLASNIYQTCVDTFKHAKLREEEAVRLIRLYEESIEVMRAERAQFEKLVEERLQKNQYVFNNFFNNFDEGVMKSDLMLCINSMSEIASYFGKELKHADFEDFDSFMKSNDTLIL
ncbi:hypothetical protein [Phosphitispora fastidiosa]|uniref:hypothetical protein n=1 Tax=Phosphitispora fastidiosa TaxID=2837202 RepID=UPI001E5BDCC4|nr:hypothetical protein [Phosphitispora fastidiosa]MBU7005815.1 hypothetical protein [Phosphitispora fastidiosa]